MDDKYRAQLAYLNDNINIVNEYIHAHLAIADVYYPFTARQLPVKMTAFRCEYTGWCGYTGIMSPADLFRVVVSCRYANNVNILHHCYYSQNDLLQYVEDNANQPPVFK